MNTESIITYLSKQKNPHAVRAHAELLYLYSISEADNGKYDDIIAPAAEKLYSEAEDNGAVTAKMLAEFEDSLKELQPAAREYTAHMVSHAHIDMNWMWGYHETVSATLETFRTVLKLMEEYLDFTYSQSQASVYQMVEKYEPEMLDEIRRRVKEKRWEVSASTWVEADKNMSSGEAQCRHLLYTKNYLSKLLGIDPDEIKIDYEPDTFGHNLFEPEILTQGGVEWLYHCRGCDERGLYRWKSPSGKELLVYEEPKWYNALIFPALISDYPKFCSTVAGGALRDMLIVYGVGDHGGGPTRRDLDLIKDMQSWPLFPKIIFSRYDAFYRAVSALSDKLEVYEGELNFIFDGCYTTQTRLKMANRLSEDRLYDAEALSALSLNTLGGKNDGMLRNAWQDTLFNQFHDILPGSCVIESREWSMGKFQEIVAAANSKANTALRNIAENIDTSSIPFDKKGLTVSEGAGIGSGAAREDMFAFSFTERGFGSVRAWHIFNTTAYERKEFVKIKVWDYEGDIQSAEIRDAEGNLCRFKVIEKAKEFMMFHKFDLLLVEISVPAFGYNTCVLTPGSCTALPEELIREYWGPRQEHHLGDRNYILENDKIYCEFDSESCKLISLIDKASGKELIDSKLGGGYFEYVEERPVHGMTSWSVGSAARRSIINDTQRVNVISCSKDEIRSSLKYEIAFGNSLLRAEISLTDGNKYLDYNISLDWLENCKVREVIPGLRFVINSGNQISDFRYKTGSGTIVRESLPHDVPSLGSIEMLPEDPSLCELVLFSDCKYGFSGNKNEGALRLIRSSYDPDPHPELMRHFFHIFVGTAADKNESEKIFNLETHKLLAFSAFEHSGNMPLKQNLLVLNSGCTVTALKPAEDEGIALRFFNDTAEPQTASVGVCGKNAYLTDVTEKNPVPLTEKDGNAEFEIKAYSYATVILK